MGPSHYIPGACNLLQVKYSAAKIFTAHNHPFHIFSIIKWKKEFF